MASVLDGILGRVRGMIARGIVAAIDDDSAMQLLQLRLLSGEIGGRIERVGQYGFTFHPKPGAVHVTLFVGGFRDHGIAVAVDDPRFRPTGLEEGEVCVYDDLGQKVYLKRTGIRVESPTRVDVVAPLVRLEAETRIELAAPIVSIQGNLEANAAGGGSSIEMDGSGVTVTAPAIDFEET